MRLASLIAIGLLSLSACAHEPAAPTAPEIKLYAMNCGELAFGDAAMFADDHSYDGVSRTLIVPCYLIRHPDGDLIWDTGINETVADIPGGVTPPDFPVHISMARKLSAQLADLGLTPADIEFLAVSHSHSDHIGNGNLFAASTWIVDAEERAYALRDEARGSTDFADYNLLENAETRVIEGDADYDVFGDGSVTIIQAPGHTPGHTILRVNLANAGPVLLTGDMWHLAESREARRVPGFNVDRAQTLASMDKIEALAAETGARVVREHVAEDFAALPAFPAALD